MGIRYEKDTILNWINEMGKFLRLLVDKWESGLGDLDIEPAYKDFFLTERNRIVAFSESELILFASSLEPEQIRPLAQLIMYDGLINKNKQLLSQAKLLFECNMKSTGNFSFDDYGILAELDKHLKS